MEFDGTDLLGRSDLAETVELCEMIAETALEIRFITPHTHFDRDFVVLGRTSTQPIKQVQALRLNTARPLYLGVDGVIYRRYNYVWKMWGLLRVEQPHLKEAEYHLRSQQGLEALLTRLRSLHEQALSGYQAS